MQQETDFFFFTTAPSYATAVQLQCQSSILLIMILLGKGLNTVTLLGASFVEKHSLELRMARRVYMKCFEFAVNSTTDIPYTLTADVQVTINCLNFWNLPASLRDSRLEGKVLTH